MRMAALNALGGVRATVLGMVGLFFGAGLGISFAGMLAHLLTGSEALLVPVEMPLTLVGACGASSLTITGSDENVAPFSMPVIASLIAHRTISRPFLKYWT